jgi:hypothetical protein
MSESEKRKLPIMQILLIRGISDVISRFFAWLSGFGRGLLGGLALGGCLRGGDDLVAGGLEFLISDLPLAV